MHPRLAASLLAVAAAIGAFNAHSAEQHIERIEPAFWWVGMKSDKLQLMVHGQDIAGFTPSVAYPGVRLASVERVANRNYVFLNLSIKPGAKPGEVDIVFRRGKQLVRHAYRLLTRETGSAARAGYGNQDVIVNLMPDRFSNGNPSNDNLPGYLDQVDRADIDAGRHGGDIQGIIDHLDYFAAMGYTAVWPTPLTESNQAKYSYHGYAATDTYRIDPRFGSNADYQRMVGLARAKGIGVIMDVVLNHIGSNHWWMQDMPAKDWLGYEGRFVPTRHARTTASDPYAASEDRKNFTQGWFEINMPDMNQRNPLVATYQIQNAIWWIEYAGISGIRVDTYGYSDHAFLSQWSRRVMEEYPRFNMVGEEWSLNPIVVSYWQRGKINRNRNGYVSSMPGMMDFPLNDTLRKALVADDSMHSGLTELYERLNDDSVYPDPGKLVLFEGNHDISRLYSALDEDLDLYKMAVAYVLTMRRIPQFYYGTEILMTSPKVRADGPFRQDFPGGWAGDTINARTGEGLSARQKQAQSFVKTLLNWRKTQAVLHDGKLLHFTPEDGTYVYFRYDGSSKVMVVLNKNRKDMALATDRFGEVLGQSTSGVDVITGKQFDLSTSLAVPARSVLVLEVK